MVNTRAVPAPPGTPPPPLAPPVASRTISRRPGLPGGRAVVGALLVVTAGVGTFTLGSDGGDGPSGRYPVLLRSVDPGEVVARDAVEWRPMNLDPDVAARTFSSTRDGVDELTGAVALVPMGRGELLQRGDVRTGDTITGDTETAGLATAQLSIPIPVDRTPPGLRRGERVAVLATYGSGDGASTVRTVQDAIVLAYDTDPEAIGANDRGRLTLALDDTTALVATAHAAQVAELTVVRTTGTDDPLPELYRRDDAPNDRAPA
jgi:hypothetical protein